jgi:eukaryotic-like serine/threonine-protein kinase
MNRDRGDPVPDALPTSGDYAPGYEGKLISRGGALAREHLGNYRILGRIGEGGMGMVFRAHDSELDRDIALKLIAEDLLQDPTSALRLSREARAAATLNHPHICQVYEVGEADGQPYIAMELVEGRTLREAIPRDGLPVADVLRLGAQVADALAHAHGRGVIHRDLKSANVVVTPEGRTKVLDFGLARRRPLAGQDGAADRDPTLTRTGAIAGTPQYMSPELMLGGEADARSDVWALGVVLHEMSAGELPFPGKTAIEIGAAVLNAMPRPLPDRVPSALRDVIGRCLEKDPTRRFSSAAELRDALEALQSGKTPLPGRAVQGARRWLAITAVAAAMLAAGALAWLAARHESPPPEVRLRQLTTNPEGNPVYPAVISPDGKYLVYGDQKEGLHLRLIETGETRLLPMPGGLKLASISTWVDWFPDGTRIVISGIGADGASAAWSVPVLGGAARLLISGASSVVVSPDGRHLAYVRQAASGAELWCSNADGGDAKRLARSDSSGSLAFIVPVWSPRSSRVAYGRLAVGVHGGRRVQLESSDLAAHARVFLGDSLALRLHPTPMEAWLPDERVVFALTEAAPNEADMNLWALRVDPSSGAPVGHARQITHWVRTSYPIIGNRTADGKGLAVSLLQYPTDVFVGTLASPRAPLDSLRRVTLDDRDDDYPGWTRDGRAILFASNRNGSMDVFEQELDESSPRSIAQGPGDQFGPRVSGDGKWILYWSEDRTRIRLMRRPLEGGPTETVADFSDVPHGVGFRSVPGPPARSVLSKLEGDAIVFRALDLIGGPGAVLRTVPTHSIPSWDLSPDGTRIAVCEPEDSLPRVRILSLAGASDREVRLDARLQMAVVAWNAAGDGWFVFGPSEDGWLILSVDAAGHCFRLVPPLAWMRGLSPSPDGRHLAFSRNIVQSNAWLLEGF